MKKSTVKILFEIGYLAIIVILLNVGRHYIGIENTLITAFALLLTGQFRNMLNDGCKDNCKCKKEDTCCNS